MRNFQITKKRFWRYRCLPGCASGELPLRPFFRKCPSRISDRASQLSDVLWRPPVRKTHDESCFRKDLNNWRIRRSDSFQYLRYQYFCKSANSRAISRRSFPDLLCLTHGCTGQCSQANLPADPKRKNGREAVWKMTSVKSCERPRLEFTFFWIRVSIWMTSLPFQKKFIFHEAKIALFCL